MIAEGEGLKFKANNQDGVLDTIMNLSGGDMRRAIQLMQSAKQLHGPETPIGKEEVIEISGLIPDTVLAAFWTAVKTNLFDSLEAEIENIVADGYSAAFLVKQLHMQVVEYPAEDLSSLQKAKIAIRMSDADKCISEGADELLQLVSMASYIQQVFHNGDGFSPQT
jgi:replication factor C subunit 2/4